VPITVASLAHSETLWVPWSWIHWSKVSSRMHLVSPWLQTLTRDVQEFKRFLKKVAEGDASPMCASRPPSGSWRGPWFMQQEPADVELFWAPWYWSLDWVGCTAGRVSLLVSQFKWQPRSLAWRPGCFGYLFNAFRRCESLRREIKCFASLTLDP